MSEVVESKLKKLGIRSKLEGLNREDVVSKPMSPVKEVRTLPMDIVIKKPNRHKFFRVVPDPDMEIIIPVIELKEDRSEMWLVLQAVMPYLDQRDYKNVKLNLAYYMDGSLFLTATGMPDENGEQNKWHRSFEAVINKAKEGWVRAFADLSAGGYKVVESTRDYPIPHINEEFDIWDYVMLAFRDRVIDTPDHDMMLKIGGNKAYVI